MKRLLVVAAVAFSASLAPALAQARPAHAPLGERMFFGGSIGLGFGDVDYVEISPLVGLHVTERLSTGVSLLYRHRKDSRFQPDLSTNDYGADLFARYRLAGPFFLEADYEYLSYEFVRFDLSTDRTDFSSLLAGGGVYQPFGRNASGYVSVLYNFSYDENDLQSPYDDPWVYRAGVMFGF